MKNAVVLIVLLMVCTTIYGGNMNLKTNAFPSAQMIPSKYTCDGANISPELSWDSAPAGTKSFALICDDPDAPSGTFTHWVLYDLAANVNALPENLAKDKEVDSPKLKQGKNGFGNFGYGGPCPPGGTHRYFFKLYALDTEIPLPAGAQKKELEAAMKGHILGQAELMGKYSRK